VALLTQRMKKRSDVRWSEVVRMAIAGQLERLEGPAGFRTSSVELRNMLTNAGVKLEKVSVKKAVSLSGKMRRLELGTRDAHLKTVRMVAKELRADQSLGSRR
jgi:hypothetical protein